MTRPGRYLIRMAVFILAVLAASLFAEPVLRRFFLGNPAVNGVIIGILIAGVIYIFRQVLLLNPEVNWIENFRRNQASVSTERMPRLLSPMATMFGDRRGGRVSLTAVGMRTLLDGIGTRLDETRETSRYLIGLLVFLGLLGTFYGLLETVGSVSGVIGGLSAGGGDPAAAFAELKSRLVAPLGGMSTAFSASLFGLAGSLVLGFLDLQASLAQNRFYQDLEEWLSGFTRISGSAMGAEMGDAPVPAYIQALLEQTADGLENLQRIMARGEEGRIAANTNLQGLTDKLSLLTEQMRAEQTILLRLAEQQSALRPVLQKISEGGGAAQDESRIHLRNIETLLARLNEEVAQGRGEAVHEIRNEIRLIARTLAALAETPAPERG
ncbi:MAG TPA: flagellar motor protein MotA [Stellaceae bacterium]|nr:flagellar motor protein MotA [Stellaceae bacterium]